MFLLLKVLQLYRKKWEKIFANTCINCLQYKCIANICIYMYTHTHIHYDHDFTSIYLCQKLLTLNMCSLWSVKVTQSCPTICDPMDYTVYGILQDKILEWVTVPSSRGSSWPRNWTGISHMAGDSSTVEQPGKHTLNMCILLYVNYTS